MASSLERACVEEFSPEEAIDYDYEGDSDPEGMSSSEESELDRLLIDEGENER